MMSRFERTQMLFGEAAMRKLESSRVAVFGAGGVGGYVIEALARSGIGALDIIDHDTVSESNTNRQILATDSSVGQYKADVAKQRVAAINPGCKVNAIKLFYLPDTQNEIDFTQFDYIVDAIDTVTGKLLIIQNAKKEGVPVISAMGTGNKLDPSKLRVADIYETSVCPLARIMRNELRKRNIDSLKVVYSEEKAMKPVEPVENTDASTRRDTPGSTAFVPSAAGLLIASEVVRNLTGIRNEE
ncbi:MAG: tRNA threonylcarbamoyladenosine dehydratase [Clostridia bacterium]|nr:tRNA threonylcarbamoyladenosine dehydratase [Clostridia bacterium]